jgi:hypothetical protein
MLFDSDSKKTPYSSPTIAKLTLEQAKQFLREATDVLESLHRDQDTTSRKQQQDLKESSCAELD